MEQADSKSRAGWWRTMMSAALLTVGAAALLGSLAARYLARAVLDTQGYLAIIAPLPRDPAVASALAQFTAAQVFDRAGARTDIQEFLPPKLTPLADPLSDTLQKRFAQVTQKFIQSDTFSALWTASNTTLQTGVLRLAERKVAPDKAESVGSLDLNKLAAAVQARLGGSQADPPENPAATIHIDLHQKVDHLRSAVRAIRSGAYALPYLAVAMLLAALAVARNQRRTLMAIGVMILLLGVALLLAFKIVSGSWLGEVTDSVYRAAAQTVYEAFYHDLRNRIVFWMILAGTLTGLTILAGPYDWARRLGASIGKHAWKRSPAGRYAAGFRRGVARIEPWLDLSGAAATLLWLLLLTTLTPATLTVILSLLLSYVALVRLIAQASRKHLLS